MPAPAPRPRASRWQSARARLAELLRGGEDPSAGVGAREPNGGVDMPPASPQVPPGWSTGPPDFVGVGFQRCGTTRWYNLIAAHPEVARPVAMKELHFFDRFHSGGFTEDDLAAYREYFPRPQGQKVGRVDAAVRERPVDPAAARAVGARGAAADDPQRPGRAAHLGPRPGRRGGGTARHGAEPPRAARGPSCAASTTPSCPRSRATSTAPGCWCSSTSAARRARDRAAAHVRLPGSGRGRARQRPRGPPAPAGRKAAARPATRAAYVEAYSGDVLRLVRDFPELDLSLWPNFAHLAGRPQRLVLAAGWPRPLPTGRGSAAVASGGGRAPPASAAAASGPTRACARGVA